MKVNWTIQAVLIPALMAACAGGCSEAAKEEFRFASRQRVARIEQRLEAFKSREQEGSERLNETFLRIRESVLSHKIKLHRDLEFIEARHQERVDRWPTRLDRTREVVGDQLDGDIESIRDAVPRLFY